MRAVLVCAAAACTLASATSALATGVVIPINVTGTVSWDGQGAAGNAVTILNVATALGLPDGTPCTMNGIGWDVTLFADVAVGPFGGSWLQELTAGFSADGDPTPDINVRPGAGVGASGTQSFASPGVLKFLPNGLPDIALPNGKLRIEFFESFDDAAGVADGRWIANPQTGAPSVLQIQAIPGPGAAALIGIGGVVTLRRRR